MNHRDGPGEERASRRIPLLDSALVIGLSLVTLVAMRWAKVSAAAYGPMPFSPHIWCSRWNSSAWILLAGVVAMAMGAVAVRLLAARRHVAVDARDHVLMSAVLGMSYLYFLDPYLLPDIIYRIVGWQDGLQVAFCLFWCDSDEVLTKDPTVWWIGLSGLLGSMCLYKGMKALRERQRHTELPSAAVLHSNAVLLGFSIVGMFHWPLATNMVDALSTSKLPIAYVGYAIVFYGMGCSILVVACAWYLDIRWYFVAWLFARSLCAVMGGIALGFYAIPVALDFCLRHLGWRGEWLSDQILLWTCLSLFLCYAGFGRLLRLCGAGCASQGEMGPPQRG